MDVTDFIKQASFKLLPHSGKVQMLAGLADRPASTVDQASARMDLVRLAVDTGDDSLVTRAVETTVKLVRTDSKVAARPLLKKAKGILSDALVRLYGHELLSPEEISLELSDFMGAKKGELSRYLKRIEPIVDEAHAPLTKDQAAVVDSCQTALSQAIKVQNDARATPEALLASHVLMSATILVDEDCFQRAAPYAVRGLYASDVEVRDTCFHTLSMSSFNFDNEVLGSRAETAFMRALNPRSDSAVSESMMLSYFSRDVYGFPHSLFYQNIDAAADLFSTTTSERLRNATGSILQTVAKYGPNMLSQDALKKVAAVAAQAEPYCGGNQAWNILNKMMRKKPGNLKDDVLEVMQSAQNTSNFPDRLACIKRFRSNLPFFKKWNFEANL